MAQDFAGRRILITGAGNGIGRASALRLAKAGATLALADRDEAALGTTAAEIVSAGGVAGTYPLDVSDSRRVGDVVRAAEAAIGPLDGLVNLAGHMQMKPIEEISDEEFVRMFAVHVLGTFYTCRAVLPGMMARRAGAIVNTASVFAIRGQANAAHYAAVKGAIVAFTKSLAREKAAYGIRANCVAPGPVATAFFARGMTGAELEAAQRERAKIIPLGKLAMPDQIAPAIQFLLSEDASHMTGEMMVIDGGEVMA